MNYRKISLAALFLLTSQQVVFAQVTKTDSVKTKDEKVIEGVQLRGNANKKSESAILVEQKKAIIQKQSMGTEEISRKGISNVEQGLTKVTGINTVDGRGIFVRGLEERYNTLLINNLGSPSNNPFQKIIALKQFPTDVVGKLNIYKTFNANLYADFAGATFDIETLTYEKPFSKVEFSVGVNSVSSFRNFRISENANTMKGYIGLNSEDRKLPSEVRGYIPENYQFTKDESIHSFKDSWNVDVVKSLPNTSIGFTTAQKFRVNDTSSLGLLFSINQGSSYEYRNGKKNQFVYNGNSIILNNNLNKTQYNYEIESSALLGLGFKSQKTEINLNAIFLQNADNMIQDFSGYRNNQIQAPEFFRVNQLDISRFTDVQLFASHKINERNQIRGGASWVNNHFSQPDRKIFNGTPVNANNETEISYGGNNFIRQYLDVNGKNYFSGYAEYVLNLGEKSGKEYPYTFTVGYNGFFDKRSNSYRFIFGRNNTNAAGIMVDIDRIQDTLNQSIQNNEIYFQESAWNFEYRSFMYQLVNAGYLTFNYKPNQNWDILLGVRAESNTNLTRYKNSDSLPNSPFINLERNQTFILPSLSVKKTLNNSSNIRFSASKTITRPILIEYMPITYINPDNENIIGNKDLKNSENYNLDLKYEVFPTSKELFAVNLFAKKIDNAIERSFVASGNSNGQTITFYNAKHAVLAGIELEGIFALKRIHENLEKFSLGANATLMYSEVKRSAAQSGETDAEANRKRTLQGAAPFTINADIKYETKNRNNFSRTASLVYNVTGKKIYGVGFSKLDNIYEKPFHQLDFVYSNQINKNWNYKFSVQNILNDTYKLDLGENSLVTVDSNSLIMTDFKRGTTYSLTVGYSF